jgi:hypothetical protein
MSSKETFEEFSNCLTWFTQMHFDKHIKQGELSVNPRQDKHISALYNIRVRANDTAILKAIDTAAQFYADEISAHTGEKIIINFD